MNLVNGVIDFFFEPNGILNYKLNRDGKTSETTLVDEGVLVYAYEVDIDNVVHLVYLLKGGELIYKVLKDNNWTKAIIGKFDTRSNYYGQLEILLINHKLHLLYSYSNYINSNIFTLYHVIYNNNIEDRNNIVRYISKKSKDSFTANKDSIGNMHLLYNTIASDFSFIYYTYYNPYTSRWLANPVRLSKDDKVNESPYIFIDSKDNIHGIWWEKSSNGYYLKYYRMSSKGKEKYKWNEINIPKVLSDSPIAFIIEENEALKILYGKDTLSKFIITNDLGLTWKGGVMQVIESIQVKSTKSGVNDSENNKQLLDQILLNQKELKLMLNNILEEQLFIKSKLIRLEESNSKPSFLSKIFNSN